MNREFMELFLERTAFPQEARTCVLSAADVLSEELDRLVAEFHKEYDCKTLDEMITPVADTSDISRFTVWMAVLILAAEKAKALYPDEQVFWDTFCDLKYKAYECKEIHGVWGNFVVFWYPIFYRGTIVKLGRLEFETVSCPQESPLTIGNVTISPGQKIYSIHIPSSGEPFTPEARLESYRRALEYFNPENGILICQCNSWLLYPEYDKILPSNSNIRRFAKEFALILSRETEQFADAWRVFGREHDVNPGDLPERTSLQRAFKQHLLIGGTVGIGSGALIFDGERILTKQQ